MSPTYGVLLAAALLLLVSGATTLRSPAAAGAALDGLGLRIPAGGRLLGAGEVALALTFLLVGGPVPTLALGAAYLGFAVVVAVGRTRGLADCGCFGGSAQVPPSGLHVVITLALGLTGVASGAAALGGSTGVAVPSVLDALATSVWAGLPLFAGAALAGWLLHLAMSVLGAMPRTGAAAVDEGPRLFSLTVPPRRTTPAAPLNPGAAR